MILLNCENAYIPTAKLNDYLLAISHTVGKGKAKFFRNFGFDESNVDILETGLLSIAKSEEVALVTNSPFGTKYVIEGSLLTPSNVTINVRTVWIIETGESNPRFVTAYPGSK